MSPAVSVIVPSFQRQRGLEGLLGALSRQLPVDGDFEVVIVDDGSSPPLDEGRIRSASDRAVRLLRTENRGPAAARNAGAAEASGSLLAFTDDDCLPAPDWLTRLAVAHSDHPDAVVGGRSVCGLPGNRWAESSQALEDAVFKRANRAPNQAGFLAGKNIAVARDRFIDFGGFDASFRFSEDREFCARWLAGGGRLVYVAEAVVLHLNPRDRQRFWSQHYEYGQGARRFHALHSGGRVKVDLADYASFAGEAIFGPRREGVSRLTVLFLIVLSQFASAIGYLRAPR